MDNGWIKLHRSILDWEWWDDANCFRLFVYCLIKANPSDKKWMGKTIERGTFVTSLDKICLDTGLSQRSVRTSIDKLINTGEICKKTTNKYTTLTICNYDKYQVVDDCKRQTNDKQTTNERQTNDKQTTTTKNIKKDKKERKEENIMGENTHVHVCVCEEDILVGIRDFYEQHGMRYIPNTTTYQAAKEICGSLRLAFGENATAEDWRNFLNKAWKDAEDWSWLRNNFTLDTIAKKFSNILNHKNYGRTETPLRNNREQHLEVARATDGFETDIE